MLQTKFFLPSTAIVQHQVMIQEKLHDSQIAFQMFRDQDENVFLFQFINRLMCVHMHTSTDTKYSR